MPPLKILTLTSLLALAIAAPTAFAQTADKTPTPASGNIPIIRAVPGDATAIPVGQNRHKKRSAKHNRSTDTAKAAPSPSAPAMAPN
jgi:hypothetical protein